MHRKELIIIFVALSMCSSANSVQVNNVTVDQCTQACHYDTSSLDNVMNCTQRQCTYTPEFDTSYWSSTKNVNGLYLRDNMIENVTLFSQLKYLQVIDLTNSQVKTITKGAFSPCDSLKALILADNLLHEAPASYFEGLEHLEILDLSSNDIKVLHTGDLSVFQNLRVLRLQRNGLHTIDTGALDNLRSLEYLHLEDNSLREFELDMSNKKLIELNLQRNNLAEIKRGEFFFGDNLEFLDLEANQIKRVETGAFSGVGNLRVLNLKGNIIDRLEVGVLNDLLSLEDLVLDDNHIADISVGSLPINLQKFSLKVRLIRSSRRSFHMFVQMSALQVRLDVQSKDTSRFKSLVRCRD